MPIVIGAKPESSFAGVLGWLRDRFHPLMQHNCRP